MPVLDMPGNSTRLLRHTWIADISRFYTVSSTPDYDVVTVQTHVMVDRIPMVVYIKPSASPSLFRVDDGGFLLDYLSSPYKNQPFNIRSPFLSRRLRRCAANENISYSRGVFFLESTAPVLSDSINNLAESASRIFKNIRKT